MMRRLCLFTLLLVSCLAVTSRADQPSPPLSVVSYNIRYANPQDGLDVWPNRVDAVVDFIAQHDIVGLQEVTFSQLGDLRERLAGFDWYGVGRDDGKTGGEHAVIFYSRDRIEAVEKGTFWLSEHPEKVGLKGWDAALPRTCTWMLLRDKATNHRVWIANTHFDHRGGNARTESGKLIRRVAAEKGGSLPVIVIGDFNCVPDSDPYRALTASGSDDDSWLVDVRKVSKTAPTGPTSTWNGFHEIVPRRIIDHVFVRGPLEVVEVETLNPKTQSGRFASDHLPVRATIRLQAAKTTPAE